ncbi:MAG TPA: hypothetical protein VIW24_04140 [Aldersonia sp.]
MVAESSNAPVAAKVDELFQRRWPDGNPAANAEVARYVTTVVGHTIDRQYVWRIRTGRVKKIDVPVLEAIGEYFGETLAYFSGKAPADEDLAQLLAATGLEISGFRSAALTAAGRRELQRVLVEANEIMRAARDPRSGSDHVG